MTRGATAYRIAVVLVPVTVFLSVALLWMFGAPSVYHGLLRAWGIAPGLIPFIDIHAVLAAVECHARGVDVYAANPCDILSRPHVYSPLWLRLGGAGVSVAQTPIAGLLMAAGFFGCIAYLMRPKRITDLAACLALIGSTMVVFALERANNDLIIFVLTTLAGALLLHATAVRLGAYALFGLAGGLKFYPLVLFVAAAHERLVHAVLLAVISMAIVGVGFALVWDELLRAFSLIPRGAYFGDMFGAVNLAHGLALMTAKVGGPTGSEHAYLAALLVAAAAGAICLAVLLDRDGVRLDPHRREDLFLLLGAALLVGCFVSGQSIGYRGVFFLFLAPWLLNARAQAARPRQRGFAALILVVVAGLMWGDAVRFWLYAGMLQTGVREADMRHADLVVWGLRELGFWGVMTFLSATILLFLARSAAIGDLRQILAPTAGGRGTPTRS